MREAIPAWPTVSCLYSKGGKGGSYRNTTNDFVKNSSSLEPIHVALAEGYRMGKRIEHDLAIEVLN